MEPGPHQLPKRKRRWIRVLGWIAVAGFLVGAVVYIVADHLFNVGSNLIFWANQNSPEPLLVLGQDGTWSGVHDIPATDLEEALKTVHTSDGVKFQQLRVRRKEVTATQKIVGAVFTSEVNIFTIDVITN